MSLIELHEAFLASAVAELSADDRVAAVLLTGSGGRGEADDWSDLDINVVLSGDASDELLASAGSAEAYGDVAIWVDCSYNAPLGGSMTFARYLVGDDLVLVDWHVWPLERARLTTGAKLLWSRPGLRLEPFAGTVVDLTSSGARRRIPPYSRQQRSEWELCMLQIAASRPARSQDASSMGALLGIEIDERASAGEQLERLDRHLDGLAPWVAPRAWQATKHRLDQIRSSLH